MLYEYGEYCAYLRKSRADREAELRGEGETLTRHEKILMNLAKSLNISVKAIYKEVVSGETISARPMMQQLLHEVESGMWDGVLVVEVERLARGDTIDQGVVSRAFQLSDTRIITPTKIYDPKNEFDEEYFEFGLFMSRREYKTIKRRLNSGRISSINEGKYVGNRPPYGYRRVKLKQEKGFTLEPVSEQAAVVRMIYNWYVHGEQGERLGMSKIVRKLNTLGIPASLQDSWTLSSVNGILSNPIYIGKVRWNYRKTVKKMVDGQLTVQRPRSEDFLLRDGLHPAIISKSLYDAAQKIRSKNPPRPTNTLSTVKNPLSGLVFCGNCGHSMVRRPYHASGQKDSLICSYSGCFTVSSKLDLVEQAVIDSLWDLLKNYQMNLDVKDTEISSLSEKEILLSQKEKEMNLLSDQKGKLYDLLEQGVYSTEVFLERSEELHQRILSVSQSIKQIQKDLEQEQLLLSQKENFIPQCTHILEHYYEWDIATRNNVLKELIDKVIYTKTTKNKKGHGNDITFTLEIYPRVL